MAHYQCCTLELERTSLVKAPSERSRTIGRRSWKGLSCCWKKLRTSNFELRRTIYRGRGHALHLDWQHSPCQTACLAISGHSQSEKNCFESFHSRFWFSGILAMLLSVQNVMWIAKDSSSRRWSRSQQERSEIAGSFRRTSGNCLAIWPHKCVQYEWLVFLVASET